MKKAHLILGITGIFTITSGIMAFKAARFNGLPVWHSTTWISTLANNKLYFTYGNFCTSFQPTRFFSTTGQLTVVSLTSPWLPPTTVLGTAIDGSGATTSIWTFPCTTTLTRVTTLN